MNTNIVFGFEDLSAAEQQQFVLSLRDALLDASPDVQVSQVRADDEAQDFGGTLAVLLGTPAIVLVAKALRDWLTRTNAASLYIKTANGVVIARNLESKDIPAITSALRAAAHNVSDG